MRRLSVFAAMWVVLLAMLAVPLAGTAAAQDGDAGETGDEEPVEVQSYGDAELIEALRTYGLLDEWIAASPVSPQASLLLVSGNGSYQTQRRTFLNSLEAWAARTESVRNELARIDAAQLNSDRVRSAVIQVRDALVLDDRLASDSKTLVQIEDALAVLEGLEIPVPELGDSEDPLTLAELQLGDLRERAHAEMLALNGSEPAVLSSGVGAFVGFEDLELGLTDVDGLIERGRRSIRPAREQSERLVSSAVAQIPNLHAARMLGSSDVDGLSIVTIDAYMRAAARAPCSVDWALLAGIGKIESNHGRIGGASVSRSGQVSTSILGPLLDGGETDREIEEAQQLDEDRRDAVAQAVEAARERAEEERRQELPAQAEAAAQLAAQAAFENSLWGLLRHAGDVSDGGRGGDESSDGASDDDGGSGDQGNGFAVVVDSDGGRLDGNERWDRAIGPMQFLPETWSKWATDGNGDGFADPHNLYDAATSAGRFLCHLSATRGSSPSTFVLGYNGSTSYVRSVLSTAQRLRATSLPDT